MEGRKTLTVKGSGAQPPQRLLAGRYLLKGAPQAGVLASVYRALDSAEERVVAVKLFRALHARDGIVEESFRRETQALSDLKHPNIVQILDFGIDEVSGEHFIVMEWGDRDLDRSPVPHFADWPSFFRSLGRPVLEAIAFAHTHATVHRDIKPSNILLTEDGIPKVCDFGISKIRNFLEPGVTLSQFASIPYAPPEPDDGTYSYTRDVFGFAALCVALLSNKRPTDYRGLHACLEELTLDTNVKRLLRRCLAVDTPGERPVSAPALLAEFERASPATRDAKEGVVLLAPTNKVRDILKVDMAINDDNAMRHFIAQDLSDARVVLEEASKDPQDPPAFRLYGDRYGYIAKPGAQTPERLLLVSALELPTSQLEERRDDALNPPFRFAFEGATTTASRLNIASLMDRLLQFAADQKVLLLERRGQAIFNTWLNLLSAKSEVEKRRKKTIPYTSAEESGGAIRFFVDDGINTSVLDEQDVRIEVGGDREFVGTVVSIRDDSVLVKPKEFNVVDFEHLHNDGLLLTDTAKADASLDKQKAALDAVRYGRSVNAKLGSYIVSPAEVPVSPATTVEFVQTELDEDKRRAVESSMGRPDLLVIQGPPGTGKTTFITELVLQTLRRDPEARILLSSQTHVALDNSLERIISKKPDVRALRIGREEDERIAASTRSLLLERQLPVLKRTAMAQGRKFLEQWAASHGVDIELAKMAMALERNATLRERTEVVEARIAQLRPLLEEANRENLEAEERAEFDQEVQDRMKERDALLRDQKEAFAEVRKYESDTEALEHFATCSAKELREWADSYTPTQAQNLKKLLAAHSEWEARFGRTREFRAALVASSQVVAGTCVGVMSVPGRLELQYDLCIVDEASIATPTEVLVPMSRARRTILVGDSRQLSPFQDPELETSGLLTKYQLTRQDQKQTLFNHLADGLPESLRKGLSTQHRMIPGIGNLISSCFYEGKLSSVQRPLRTGLERTMQRPIVWFSTCRLSRKESQRVGTTYANDTEVEQVVALLTRANLELTSKQAGKISVAVLTGYGLQKDRLAAAVEAKRRAWTAYTEIFVNVVDAFQGREADLAIFSVTRSDKRGLGFLREMERINVALSRGRNFLAVVGDHVFCQEAEGRTNPLRTVLDYIRANPNDCLLKEIEP